MEHDSDFGFPVFAGTPDKIPQKGTRLNRHTHLFQEGDDVRDFSVDSAESTFIATAGRIREEAPHEKMQFQFVIFIVSHAPKASPRKQIV